MNGRLAGKVAIITGAGFGFGEGITTKFVTEGAKVVLVDINVNNGEKVTKAQPMGTATFIQGDVSSEFDWKRLSILRYHSMGELML